MARIGLAMKTNIPPFRGSTSTGKAVFGRCMSKITGNNDKLTRSSSSSMKDEHCWVPHPRTGIYYPIGHEWVMEDVPDGAAYFARTHWLRNSDNIDDGVDDLKPNFTFQFPMEYYD